MYNIPTLDDRQNIGEYKIPVIGAHYHSSVIT